MGGTFAGKPRVPLGTVEKAYAFDGPAGKVSLLDLFEGRRQLIVYRARRGAGKTRSLPHLA